MSYRDSRSTIGSQHDFMSRVGHRQSWSGRDFSFIETVSYSPCCPQMLQIGEDDFELLIHLLLSPKYLDYVVYLCDARNPELCAFKVNTQRTATPLAWNQLFSIIVFGLCIITVFF